MYNYDFKDKWEGKKEAGGMPKKWDDKELSQSQSSRLTGINLLSLR